MVPEPAGGAHADSDEAARLLKRVLIRELAELQNISMKRLLKWRYKKFRKMGEYSTHFREAVRKEVSQLRGYVVRGVKKIRRRRRKKMLEAQVKALADKKSTR